MAEANDSGTNASFNQAGNARQRINPPSNDWIKSNVPDRKTQSSTTGAVELLDRGNLDLDGSIESSDRIDEKAGSKPTAIKKKDAKKARDLATGQINELHGDMMKHGRTTLELAIAIGGKLVQVKAQLKHGEFSNWIATSLKFDQKTAERYMKLYNGRKELKNDTMSNITNALRLIDAKGGTGKSKGVKALHPVGTMRNEEQLQAQIVVVDKPSASPTDAAEKPEGEGNKPGAPALRITGPPKMPVFVAFANEEVLALLMDAVKLDDKCQYQVIRPNGEIKLNQHFIDQLGLTV